MFTMIAPLSISTVRFAVPPNNRRSSSSAALTEATPEFISAKAANTNKNILGCPICFDPLTSSGDSSLSLESVRGTTLRCSTCKKVYNANKPYFDLTATSGAKDYAEPMPFTTEFFRFPFMSFLYERGWRQNFELSGFPGPDKELEMAKEYLKPVLGGMIVDASCGSGLFSRLFATSGLFSQVIALDYSEAMLQQCYDFVKEDQNFPTEKLIPVRADVSRLPFVSGSVDAVHAGAALHCWPSPFAAVAETSRVLRPGGVFVATTFIADALSTVLPMPLRKTSREFALQFSGFRVFLSESELEDLCTSCGLVNFTCTRNRRFVMISATKPS